MSLICSLDILIIGQHRPLTLGQTGHCIKTRSMNTINTSNRTNKLSQLWEKQIEPHKNLQKSFFKTPNIIPINENQTFSIRSAENSNMLLFL
jgi:hypothetical protein